MKQFIKNNIKTFITVIITTIVVGSLSVYAASQYFAKDISFTPTNENFKKENGDAITNVEDALNELYGKSLNNISENISINGFVAFFNQVFTDGSSSEREVNIENYNSQYATKNNNNLIIKEPGIYTAYYTVGHSPKNNTYRSDGKLYLNNQQQPVANQSYISASGTMVKQFTVSENIPVSIKYTLTTQINFSAGSFTSFGSVVIVKNS